MELHFGVPERPKTNIKKQKPRGGVSFPTQRQTCHPITHSWTEQGSLSENRVQRERERPTDVTNKLALSLDESLSYQPTCCPKLHKGKIVVQERRTKARNLVAGGIM